MPHIPLIEDLTKESIPPGSNLLVEFDPASQWYNASFTIAAGWIRSGGAVDYNATAQPLTNIRSKLNRLGLDVETLERESKLELNDWYTATLGKKSNERLAETSLKVADLSIDFLKPEFLENPSRLAELGIRDNASTLARFNDEKAWVEFEVTRAIQVAVAGLHKSVWIRGVVKGVHSEWVYKRLEDAYDGIIDFKIDEERGEVRNLMRIRSMRGVGFDSRWHRLKIGDNLEVTLEK